MTHNNLSEQNPFIDPKLKSVWQKGYAAGLQSATEEIERLKGENERMRIALDRVKIVLSIHTGRDANLNALLVITSEALKQQS